MLLLQEKIPPIITSPSPVLRSQTVAVEDFGESLSYLAQRMTAVMDAFGGIGLAAPQVGSLLSLTLVRIDDERVLPLANPQIKDASGSSLAREGCLSLPGLEVVVRRNDRVKIEAQDLQGDAFTIDLDRMQSRIAQHEIDHLQGKLILDHMWSRDNPRRGYHLISQGAQGPRKPKEGLQKKYF